MDAINTTLKFTKQEPQRIFALIIMHLRLVEASEAHETGSNGIIEESAMIERRDADAAPLE
jgi:hypothetical protein